MWPASPEATGLLLRGQALRMLEELQGMAAAFGAALAEAGGCSARLGVGRLGARVGGRGGPAGCPHAYVARAPANGLCAGGFLDGAAGGKAYAHVAGQQAHALQADSEAAAARLQDACRSLVQVVWVTSVPRATVEELLD